MPRPSPVLMNAIRRSLEDAPGAAGGQHHELGLEDVHLAGFHLERGHADDSAFGIADQVERHPFDEEIGARLDVLLIERVQHRVAGPVGRGAGRAGPAFRHRFAVWPPNGRW
jgi:hypothetical protein